MRGSEKGEVRRKIILSVMLLVIFVSIIFTWSVLDAVTQYNDVREMSIGNQPIKETMLTPKVAVDITNPNYLPNEAEEEL